VAIERAVASGPCRLPPAQRLLLEADERRSLGVRSLDILIGMVERPGALVGREGMPESGHLG
jgi:DNA-binding winged helix-turn-helix (wHTH) protein